ncbi:sensor histidine kinase [Anaerorhabdus sp.]|uniref:sensor histidine kinase n=1 Tax=Anaerorhabdus sp. TaxID=1872524 RepID=UPI002FC83ADB
MHYSYICFAIVGSIFAIISFMFLDTQLSFIIAYFGIMLLCKYLYKINWMQDVFFANDFTLILLLSGGMTPAFFSIISKTPMNMMGEGISILETIIAFLLAIIITYIFNMKLISHSEWTRFIRSNNQFYKFIFFQYCIIFLVMCTIPMYDQKLNIIISYYQFFGLIIITILYRLLVIFAVKSSVAEIYRIRSDTIAEQLENQIILYNNQVNYDKEIRKFRHDFNSLILVINQLLNENKYDEIKTVIAQTANIEEDYLTINPKFSNNVFIQAILINTYYLAQKSKVKYSATVSYPENLRIDEIDLCRIFTNLMNNAIDACRRIDYDKRFINITSIQSKLWFTLIVRNSFNGEVNESHGVLYSTKENKNEHGFGLKIIEETIEKYGGFQDITWENNEFVVKLHIPLNE